MDDAIDLLKHDHRMVEQLFRDYHAAASDRQRRAVVETLVREPARHAAVEELIFYPFAAAVLEDESLIGRHLHEHATVKHLLAELDRLKEGDERTGELMERLRNDVEAHIHEEECRRSTRRRPRPHWPFSTGSAGPMPTSWMH